MRIGVAHVKGKYTVPAMSGTQFADGCDAVWNAGFRTIKLYITGDYVGDYPLQTSWSSSPTTLTELAQTTEFATQLGRGWNVVMLTAFPFCTTDYSRPVGQRVTNYWRVSFTDTQKQDTYTEMYDLGCHLLSTYDGTGTEFILQNWEGDWAFMDAFVPETPVNRWLVNQYLAFLATRQKAIADARRDTPSDCKLLMAYEANRTLEARTKPHLRRLLRDMAPKLQPDIISLSAYDFMIDTAIGFGADYATWAAYTLPLCAKALRQNQLRFPGVPIQIGEFGFPEVQAASLGRDVGVMINDVAAICAAYGVTDFVYWEVFDNEEITPGVPAGYWTVKPDGSVSVAGAALALL